MFSGVTKDHLEVCQATTTFLMIISCKLLYEIPRIEIDATLVYNFCKSVSAFCCNGYNCNNEEMKTLK